MNDTELDDMLNKWDAPPVPRGLRERISPGRTEKRRFRLPSGLFFGVGTCAAVLLLVVAVAAPQALGLGGPPPRFLLLSETIAYNDDGLSAVREYRRTTAQKGAEIIIDRQVPDSWFMTIHMNFFDTVHRLLGMNPGPPESMGADCSRPNALVAGQETVLGYETTKLIYKDQATGRYIEWRAPQLDCIPMKTSWEKKANGEFRLSEERRPLKVIMNPSQ